MSEIKLLPCPFCGGEAEIVGKHWVQCRRCATEGGYYDNIETAIEVWNTRKPMERIVERLEESADQCIKIGDVYGFSATNEAIFVVKEEGGIE
jgi:hypothetical protein